MLSHTDLDRLLDAMRATGTTELRVTSGSDLLELGLAPLLVRAEGAPIPRTTLDVARSPAIGFWQSRGLEDGLSRLSIGDSVMAGEILGYVRHALVLWPVAAPADGVLVDLGPDEDTLLGHGDPVLQIRSTQ